MSDLSAVIGYILLGLVEFAVGFVPIIVAFVRKNENKMQILKADAIAVFGLGLIGTIFSSVCDAFALGSEVWVFVVVIIIEVIRLAAWVYLLIMAIKDKELPIF